MRSLFKRKKKKKKRLPVSDPRDYPDVEISKQIVKGIIFYFQMM